MSDVFISYSRKDIAFAKLLFETLQRDGMDTWIDWQRIPIGEDWWKEICSAIESAEVFMFIISRHSIDSQVCKREINHALSNNKRVIPIVLDNLSAEVVAQFVPDLSKINWIVFQRDKYFEIQDIGEDGLPRPEDEQVAQAKDPQFREAWEKLGQAIRTDWEWVKFHTRLQVKALTWEAHPEPGYLLHGEELEEAEDWLARAAQKDPQPTVLQAQYITTSRQEETRRQRERQLLEHKAQQRQRFALWAVGIGLAVAVVLGILAWSQRNQYLDETYVRATAQAVAVAEANQRATAEAVAVDESHARATQQVIAEEQRDLAYQQARLALSGKLNAYGMLAQETFLDLAMLLNVQSYRTAPTADSAGAMLRGLLYSPRLLQVWHSHTRQVRALAVSPDGRMVASGGCGEWDAIKFCLRGEVFVRDAETGGLLLEVDVPQDLTTILALSFSPDGNHLFLVAEKGGIAVVDVRSGRLIKSAVISGSLQRAVFSPDGRLLAVGTCLERGPESSGYCSLGGVRVWDMSTLTKREPILTVPANVWALAFSQDGRYLAVAAMQGDVYLFDVDMMSAAPTTLTLPATDSVWSLQFSSDGGRLFAGHCNTYNVKFNCLQGQVSFWDVNNPTSEGAMQVAGSYQGLDDFITSLAISPDGRLLAAGAKDGSLQLWDVQTGVPVKGRLAGFAERVVSLVFHPSGERLYSTTGTKVAVWDAKYGSGSVEENQAKILGFTLPWNGDRLKFSPTGNRLFLFNGKIASWMPEDGPSLTVLQEDAPAIGAVAFAMDGNSFWSASSRLDIHHHDGQTGAVQEQIYRQSLTRGGVFSDDGNLVAGGGDGWVKIWNTVDGSQVVELELGITEYPSAMAFHPQGGSLAVALCVTKAAPDTGSSPCAGSEIRFYDLSSGKKTGKVAAQPGRIKGLAFSPDGKKLVAVNTVSAIISMWDVDGQEPTATPVKEIDLSAYFDAPNPALGPGMLAISPDGHTLAAASDWKATLVLWDLQNDQVIGQPLKVGNNLKTIRFSPDGSRLAVGSDGVFLVDPRTAQLIGDARRDLDFMIVNSLAFSPDGKRLAAGDDKSRITIWDLASASKKPIHVLLGHADGIEALVFSADGERLYSFARGNLNQWDAAAGNLLAQPLFALEGAKVAFSPDGKWLAAIAWHTQDGLDVRQQVRLFDLATKKWFGLPMMIQAQTSNHAAEILFSPDGSQLAVGVCIRMDTGSHICQESEMSIWDVATRQKVTSWRLEGELMDILFPDLTHLYTCTGTAVVKWTFAEEQPVADQITDGGNSIAISPDGKMLAVGKVNEVIVLDIETRQQMGYPLQGQFQIVYDLDFSADGKWLAGGTNSGMALVWNVEFNEWMRRACSIANRNLTVEEWELYLPGLPYEETCP